MSQYRWLTPADYAPADFYCRRILIPRAVDWLSNVNGALLDLTYPDSFEVVEGIDADTTAQTYLEMYRKFVVEEPCMLGWIIPYVTSTPPLDTLPCDGSVYNRVDYPGLYASLDSVFIVDADTFVTPDLRGRTIIGTGTGPGLTARSIGDSIGEEAHELTDNENGLHNHSVHDHGVTLSDIPVGLVAVSTPAIFPTTTGDSGASDSHNNMQPSLALNYCVIAV